jgi:hypothetical protein
MTQAKYNPLGGADARTDRRGMAVVQHLNMLNKQVTALHDRVASIERSICKFENFLGIIVRTPTSETDAPDLEFTD